MHISLFVTMETQILMLVGVGEEGSLFASLFSIYQSIFDGWKIEKVI